MLSVKSVCVVMGPVNRVARKTPPVSGRAGGNGLSVSSDPKSRYRYSNFHVQFDGSQYANLPSMPAPTAKPTLVLDAPNALVPGARKGLATLRGKKLFRGALVQAGALPINHIAPRRRTLAPTA
jgi:hypothetical protein